MTAELDTALDQDIRLLGRLLGDLIAEQAGPEAFALVERIRREAVQQRKTDGASSDRIDAMLVGIDQDTAIIVVRAFSWFPLLANIAEDVHYARRRRSHRASGSPAPRGTIENMLGTLRAAGLQDEQIMRTLVDVQVSPVLTAHPTEVRRKTILDTQRRIAELLVERDRTRMDAEELQEWEASLKLQVLTLWQTSLLRLAKLRARDEIAEALRYYELTFFQELPALQRAVQATVESLVTP